MSNKISDTKICVVGLGYVGLPLACLLSKKFEVDMSDRIQGLEDKARELEEEQRHNKPDDYEGYGSRRESEVCSDGDIDSLFGTLKS